MAGIGPHAIRLDQVGARIRRAGNVLGNNATPFAGRAPAHRRPIVQPLDPPGFLRRNARAGVQVQLAGALVHQEVEEHLAVEVLHHLATERFHRHLGLVAAQQLAGGFGQKVESGGRLPKRLFGLFASYHVHDRRGKPPKRIDVCLGVIGRLVAHPDNGHDGLASQDGHRQIADDGRVSSGMPFLPDIPA